MDAATTLELKKKICTQFEYKIRNKEGTNIYAIWFRLREKSEYTGYNERFTEWTPVYIDKYYNELDPYTGVSYEIYEIDGFSEAEKIKDILAKNGFRSRLGFYKREWIDIN
tara:strand:+ start:495 stop:827 length:333 start_codon:yes stop_codon:yes gene_type:complete